ncbi:type I pantothenate kinase [Pelosinus baikalensis]|uniref:Pantothenate kinase n=1 Tax=Pelosinus baikalensis TaxID=2892015 RepID=A0ABS8HY85_9FIRM|nr:type I pantothenate kinase [Pelosinus baikalensis]MCC5468141.1 type I pantothenate kinase [Pelosinus baikalensis]
MNNSRTSPYISFTRENWETLRMSTPLTISEEGLAKMRGINEQISLEEVVKVYLPLSRLLNLYVLETRRLYEVTNTFLGALQKKVPYIIGIAGSVAVGKSTTARIIQALLASWPTQPRVSLVTTDGFLYPNKLLEERGIMKRKGFPESYDVRRIIEFLREVKSGRIETKVPVYSHLSYDIIPDQYQLVDQPDILIVEGANVLQTPQSRKNNGKPYVFISDFFDFTIYVHAEEKDIKRWYIERFQTLRRTAFQDKTSFFHQYTKLSEDEATNFAKEVWEEINAVNLKENIYPTINRARLIIEKRYDHSVQNIMLRKL